MDVAVYVIAEFWLVIIMIGDNPGLAVIEQPHGAPRKDAAVAFQIGRPCGVSHFIRQDFGYIDRRRVQRFGQQRDPARKGFIINAVKLFARMCRALFQVCGQFGHRLQLRRHPLRGLFRQADVTINRGFYS